MRVPKTIRRTSPKCPRELGFTAAVEVTVSSWICEEVLIERNSDSPAEFDSTAAGASGCAGPLSAPTALVGG